MNSPAQTASANVTGAKILIADDRPADLDYYRTVLGYVGYDILEASDGAAALELIRSHRPDLVLTDVMMPTLDGYALMRAIRADAQIAATPVIFCTAAYRDQEAKQLAAAVGAASFLVKPVEPQVLIAAIGEVLRNGTPAGPSISLAEAERAHLRLLNDKLMAKTAKLEAEIVARREAEAALRRRNEELETLLETIPAMVLMADDPSCRHIRGNRAANELFGVPAGANVSQTTAIGERVLRIQDSHGQECSPDDLPMQRTAREGRPVLDSEFRLDFPDGRQVWLLGNSVPLYDDHGSVRGVIATFADITRQKAVEEALRQNKAMLAQAIQLAHLGAWSAQLVDPDDFMASRARWLGEMYRILGYSPAEVEPSFEALLARVHPEDRKSLLESVLQAMAEKRSYNREYRMVHPDGSERIVWECGEFRYDCQGRPIHFIGAIQDITARKRIEQELCRHRDDLESLVADRTADLLVANRELQAFTYAASHDLKAPLGRINAFSGMLEQKYRDRLGEEGVSFLDFIRQNAARMTTLIDDLLNHAQIEQRILDLNRVDLRAAVQSILHEKAEDIRQGEVKVAVDMPAILASANPLGLAQVLRNLLDNALKYSRQAKPPAIEIGAQVRDGHCRLWVRDNGIGFDMAYHDKIFEIFRRLHTYNEYPGSGVGLALVKKAMERMGGRVWAESSPGKGAVFFLEMPVWKFAGGELEQ